MGNMTTISLVISRKLLKAVRPSNLQLKVSLPITEESSAGIEETTASVEETSSSLEQLSRNADTLEQLSGELQSMVKQFKL